MSAVGERLARLGLSCVTEAGSPRLAGLVAEHGAEAVWETLRRGRGDEGWAARARGVDPSTVEAAAKQAGARFVVPGDAEWAPSLNDLTVTDPGHGLGGVPTGLWLKGPGRLDELSARCVAVVGSRAATGYGEAVASELALELSEAGVTVISGGAYGVDAAAHQGALSGGGATAAVLASGVDRPYPPRNGSLLSRIGRDHLLVSELAPGQHPTRVRFLARNRIIAALAQGTILVEAAARSGAKNTATWSGLLGRQVMAVPGPITSGNSVTPHRLIRDHEATLVTCAKDVLAELAPLGQAQLPITMGPARPLDSLDAQELAVFEALPARAGRTAGELSLAAGLSLPECLGVLEGLAELGLVDEGPAGWALTKSAIRATYAG